MVPHVSSDGRSSEQMHAHGRLGDAFTFRNLYHNKRVVLFLGLRVAMARNYLNGNMLDVIL